MNDKQNLNIIKISKLEELEHSLKIRKKVFIEEQNVDSNLEVDHLDKIDKKKVCHFLLKYNEEFIGTLRIINNPKYLKIGRFAILKKYRNKGFGSKFLDQILQYTISNNMFNKKDKYFYLEAQVHAIPFYEKLNFKTYGEEFIDANIKHKKMIRK